MLVFCRTNFDCDNLEAFLLACDGGKKRKLGAESGKEGAYSCCVLAGARSMEVRAFVIGLQEQPDAFTPGAKAESSGIQGRRCTHPDLHGRGCARH